MRDWIHADLLAVCLVAVASPALVMVFGFDGTPLQTVLGLLFIFAAPGYATVSLLIPDSNLRGLDITISNTTEISLVERLLLAVGLSIAIIPSIGVILHFSPWMLDNVTYLSVTGILTFLITVGAIVRRGQLPRSRQFRVTGIAETFGGWLASARSDRERYLNILLVSGVIIAMFGVMTAVAMSGPGERFTEFYVQTEDPVTGEQTTVNYPTNMTVGEQYEYIIGITNQEHRTEQITIIVELHRTENGQIVETSELDRFTQTVKHEETVEESISVQPDMRGENLRLSYQLYRGTPPEWPSVEQAYRHVFIRVNVSSAGSS